MQHKNILEIILVERRIINFNDVILFLQNGSIKHKVAAIVDGWYWEENGKKNELIELFKENNNVFIFSADDYKEGKIKFVN